MALRPTLGERNSRVRVEGRVHSEPRLTVPKICLGFIADSLFSAMLIGSCRAKRPLSGFPQKTRRELPWAPLRRET